jgi:O-antigen/teichoic acid export membrane protein
MSSTVATAVLGFLFWVVAARWFPASAYGRTSAAVSSMTLLAAVAQLNLISLYARFLPTAGARTRRVILSGYAASVAMSVLLAVGFVGFGFGDQLPGAGLGRLLLFAISVLASSLLLIQDAVLTALRRTGWVPVKNVLFSVAKLLLLPVLAGASVGGLFLAWVLPVFLVVIVVNWWILARLAPAHARAAEHEPAPARPRELRGFLAAGYISGVVSNTVSFIPPVMVATVLGPVASAYFYVPWLIGVSACTLLWNVVTSFVVEASRAGNEARTHLNRAIRLGLAVIVPTTLVLALAGRQVLAIFGPEYATHGAGPLRLIALALPCTGVILLNSAFAVMEKRMWWLVAIQSTSATAFIGGSWLGLSRLGSEAPALAYLIVQAAAALLLLPRVVRRYRATGGRASRPEWATALAPQRPREVVTAGGEA